MRRRFSVFLGLVVRCGAVGEAAGAKCRTSVFSGDVRLVHSARPHRGRRGPFQLNRKHRQRQFFSDQIAKPLATSYIREEDVSILSSLCFLTFVAWGRPEGCWVGDTSFFAGTGMPEGGRTGDVIGRGILEEVELLPLGLAPPFSEDRDDDDLIGEAAGDPTALLLKKRRQVVISHNAYQEIMKSSIFPSRNEVSRFIFKNKLPCPKVNLFSFDSERSV